MRDLHGYPRITVKVEVSIDDAAPAVFEVVEDRGLLDLLNSPCADLYSRWMLGFVEDEMGPAMEHAMKLAGLADK